MQWLIDIIEETVQASFQGIIVAWSGAIVDIPDGWVICDGNNDTPNLRNRFIIGAGDTYVVSDTGGANEHEHDFTTTGHDHDLAFGEDLGAGTAYDVTTTAEVDTGQTSEESNLPPYYALAYIMKT